ncbi:MAG: O-antigen ligase family protein [Prolixibacteraceae bacterium]|nr:O-antigen ligase family protein [Prolixibacteraceae bacterium]
MPLVYWTMLSVSFFWIVKVISSRRANINNSQQNIAILFFWIIVSLSTLSLSWKQYTINTMVEWGKVTAIYFFFVSIIDSLKKIKIIIFIIISSMAITATIGILQSFGIDLTGVGTIDGRVNGIGIFGTNQLAYALVYCLPFVIVFLLLTRNALLKIFLLIILSLYIYCLFLTQSRGGYLCFIIVLLMSLKMFSKNRVIQFCCIFIGILLFILFAKFAPRFSTTFEYQSDSSALGRLDAWGSGLESLKTNYLLGIGKDQFAQHFYIAPHNSYIQCVTELGLLGLFLWLSFFYFSIKKLNLIIAQRLKDFELVYFAKALKLSLYAYLVGSYFSSSAYYIPLFILIAISVCIESISKSFKKYRTAPIEIIHIAGLELAILVAIKFLVSTS